MVKSHLSNDISIESHKTHMNETKICGATSWRPYFRSPFNGGIVVFTSGYSYGSLSYQTKRNKTDLGKQSGAPR